MEINIMIQASKYIKTGFSADDAAKLSEVIDPLFANGNVIQVDFEGITIFTTLFFNHVFAKYVLQIGPEEYKERFLLENLTELGMTTYQHSVSNAEKFYQLSEEQKATANTVLDNPDD